MHRKQLIYQFANVTHFPKSAVGRKVANIKESEQITKKVWMFVLIALRKFMQVEKFSNLFIVALF
jgi:hypothetical protein